jgi:hypothetical protein
MGAIQFRKTQLGLENPKGTSAAATALMRQVFGTLTDGRVIQVHDENIGYLPRLDRTTTTQLGATIEMAETDLTFEQGPYPFSAGVKDVVSGAANGGTTNGYKFVYTAPTTAAPTLKAYTIECADDIQEYEVPYCQATTINLSGAPGENVKISSTWNGQQVVKSTSTTLAPATVEAIPFEKGKIYLDAIGGTMGASQLSGTWLGFDLTINTGVTHTHTGDGQLYFSIEEFSIPTMTGSFTFRHNANGVAQYDDYVVEATKKLRMEWLGSALTGAGGTFANKALRIDAAIKILKATPLGDLNGQTIITLEWEALMNVSASLWYEITFCNLLAALV